MDLIKKAIIDYTKSLGYLKSKKLWVLLLLPGLISFIIGAALLYLAYLSGNIIADFLSDLYPFEFGKRAAFTFFHLVPFTYLIAIMLLKYLIYIALSPFMVRLSFKIENEASTKKPEELKDGYLFIRVLKVASRSLYKEILWTIVFCILGLIVPIAGILGIIIAQAYYVGIMHLDYTISRKKDIKRMLAWIRANRGLALGNGLVYITLLFIPFLGIIIAPIFATAAGSLSVIETMDKSEQESTKG